MNQQLAILDVEFLNTIIDDDIEFRNELFVIFKDSSNANLQKMIKSLESEDFSMWYAASHAFKGAASSIGAFALASILEQAQRSVDKNRQERELILADVQQCYGNLLKVLEKIETDQL